MAGGGLPIHVLVLAGGGGSRLWPWSRADKPKFLLQPANGEVLVQNALRRALSLTGPENVHVITCGSYQDELRRICRSMGLDSLWSEPEPRNTAAAISLGNELVLRGFGQSLVVSLPADHMLDENWAWRNAASALLDSAATSGFTCLGVVPTAPDPGLGYMEVGTVRGTGTLRVRSFDEKPSPDVATSYVADSTHLWNTGIMAWRATDFARSVATAAPAIQLGTQLVADSLDRQEVGNEAAAAAWRALAPHPIEPVLLRHLANSGELFALAADLDWADIGNWSSVVNKIPEMTLDESRLLLHGSSDCAVVDLGCSGLDKVVIVGVDDLVVVRCTDVTLIVRRTAVQNIREVLARVDELNWHGLR